MHQFLKFIYGIKLYMFRTVPLSIISIFFHCSHSKPVWHIPLLCVQWKIPDDGQSNCLTHVEFYSLNKFEKLVHLVGFIVWIYHDARSSECRSPPNSNNLSPLEVRHLEVRHLEVRHPRCVGSITKTFVYYTYSQTQLYFTY